MQLSKKKTISLFFPFIFLLSIIILGGCNKNPVSPPPPQNEKGSWTIYTPYDWSHDGQPYQSTFCTIYSDAASDEMKKQLGEIADDKFLQIMQLFKFQNLSDFKYPPGYSKIEVYINRNHTENINWAYWGGFIFSIRSSEINEQWNDYTVYTVRHELMHVFEFLIEGKEDLGTDVWFREGLAAHVGCMESTVLKTIKSLAELEFWISDNQCISGNGNPIMIHQHSDFPTGTGIQDYYRIFELAMRYIVAINGMGQSYTEILNLFYDIRNDIPFYSAFSGNFGVSLENFENDFYVLIKKYLSEE